MFGCDQYVRSDFVAVNKIINFCSISVNSTPLEPSWSAWENGIIFIAVAEFSMVVQSKRCCFWPKTSRNFVAEPSFQNTNILPNMSNLPWSTSTGYLHWTYKEGSEPASSNRRVPMAPFLVRQNSISMCGHSNKPGNFGTLHDCIHPTPWLVRVFCTLN